VNRRHTLLLVALLILAAAGYWVAETRPWTTPSAPVRQKDPLRLFTLLLPRVNTIKLEDHEGGQVASVQRGQNQDWWLAAPEKKLLDTDKMLQMGMSLTSLAAERVLTDTQVLDSFGLAQPAFSVYIIAKDSEQILDIGRATPIGGAYYAKRRDEPQIYLLGAKTLKDLRQLVDWLPSATP